MVNRGIEHREIFKDEKSFEHFVELLSKMPGRFAIKIHGYVLMGNHYHLQLETLSARRPQIEEERIHSVLGGHVWGHVLTYNKMPRQH